MAGRHGSGLPPHPLLLQELDYLLGLPPGRAVDDGAARVIRRQILHEYLVNMGQLLPAAGRHHHEFQFGALGAAVEDPQRDAQLFLEIVRDFGLDIGLGGRRETRHRRHGILSRLLTDEAPHVTVIRPEVVPPLGEAVGLVQHPGADLPLRQDPPQRNAAQLLRRDDEYAGIPQPHPLQRVGALGHGQHPVDGDTRPDAPRLQARHLASAQPGARSPPSAPRSCLAGQGRELIAE